jgi:cyclopropane fatty-acyl-phospholipid synthase-like methyltransferase
MKYPKSLRLNLDWMKENEMGPNAVWLMEYLTNGIEINRDMRILDLGSGKAISSIFIAKEYAAQVWAYDLWISPTVNYKNIVDLNVEDLVFPIHGEAHVLPFAESFFDIILSVDAYHYFGTDENYLNYILKYLKKDGIIGIVSPGLVM